MRWPRWVWVAAFLAAPVLFGLILGLGLGIGWQDVSAIARNLRHRQAPVEIRSLPEDAKGDLEDFLPLEARMMVVKEGGLWSAEGGGLRALEANQGLLRLFPGEAGGVWLAGSYHRVLAWDPAHGLRFALSVRGTVRGLCVRGDRLVVGFESERSGQGLLKGFRRQAGGYYEPEGPEIEVGMDRWSSFELSPEGDRVLANLPDGQGVAVWHLEDGVRLRQWPAQRMARVLAFLDQTRVAFDLGPKTTIREGAYAREENRLVRASVASGALETLVQGFATPLSATRLPGRLAFSDMEGLVRIVSLDDSEPAWIFALQPRGIPWRLRGSGSELWVHRKGEPGRLERYPIVASSRPASSATTAPHSIRAAET